MAIIDDVILEVQDGFDAPEQESEEQRNERLARLDAFAEELVRSRSEAIAYRRRLNIDLEWVEDLEHYEGIDDANRHEETTRALKLVAALAKQARARV